jgi:hypothetical protein
VACTDLSNFAVTVGVLLQHVRYAAFYRAALRPR